MTNEELLKQVRLIAHRVYNLSCMSEWGLLGGSEVVKELLEKEQFHAISSVFHRIPFADMDRELRALGAQINSVLGGDVGATTSSDNSKASDT